MGMFDSVNFTCPECGGKVEVQSKAGNCDLEEHPPECVPMAIAADIEGECGICYDCGESFRVYSLMPLKGVPMGIK